MFLNNDTVVVGGESATAEIHSLIEKKQMASWSCHDTRVRCMTLMSSADSSLLVTASSSDHKIKLWDVSQAHVSGHVECVGEVDTTCRVTRGWGGPCKCTDLQGVQRINSIYLYA